MTTSKQGGSWVVPGLLMLGFVVLGGFLAAEQPAWGWLLAFAVIGAIVGLVVRTDWQDLAFNACGITAPAKRYAVLAVGLLFMLATFVGPSETETQADDAGDGQGADAAPAPAQPATPVDGGAGADRPFDARVSPATAAQLDKIASGLEDGFALQRDAAWMVRSTAHDDAHYVVAYFDGPGVTDVLGAWSCSGDPKAGSGMVLSANAKADEFSVWPNGLRTKAQAWLTDADCADLLDYARRSKP